MGMYTEMIFGARLKENTPKEVIDTLQYMVRGNLGKEIQLLLPKHELFKCPRWDMLFRGGSAYFPVFNFPTMTKDEFDNTYALSTRANLKNYDNEIKLFLDWIKPYVMDGSGGRDFYAIVCYEDQDEPTIYYLEESIMTNNYRPECGVKLRKERTHQESMDLLTENGFRKVHAYRALGYTKEAFNDEDWFIRLEAYQVLGFTTEAFKDKNFYVRIEAYRVLGFTKEALRDEHEDLRDEARIYFRAKELLETN